MSSSCIDLILSALATPEEDWHRATSIARAFGIGKNESESVSNLMVKVAKQVVDSLADAVRTRGMAKFVTHECLARDILNTAFSSGVSGLEHWKDHLRNEEDGKLVSQLKDILQLGIVILLVPFIESISDSTSDPPSGMMFPFCRV